MMAVGVVEISGPQGAGDIVRLVCELNPAFGERLVSAADIFRGKDYFHRPRRHPYGSGERFTQTQRHAAAIQEREAFVTASDLQTELAIVELYRTRNLRDAKHYDADLYQLEILWVHPLPPAYHCTHAGCAFRLADAVSESRIYTYCRASAGTGNWGEHGDLQRGVCGAAPPLSVPEGGPPGDGLGPAFKDRAGAVSGFLRKFLRLPRRQSSIRQRRGFQLSGVQSHRFRPGRARSRYACLRQSVWHARGHPGRRPPVPPRGEPAGARQRGGDRRFVMAPPIRSGRRHCRTNSDARRADAVGSGSSAPRVFLYRRQSVA